MMTDKQCPVCTNASLAPHRIGSTPMLRCPACGVIVSIPTLEGEDLDRYYETDYVLTNTIRESTEKQRYFRYPEYRWLVGSVAAYRQAPARWLDVGSDHGFFLDVCRRYGYSVAGVELARGARAYASNIGLEMYKSISEVTSSYDVVSMWHVLEHIPEPKAFIMQLRERLNDRGVLAIRVPDAGSFWARILRDKWIWFQHKQHAVHYTRTTLQNLIASCGFDVASCVSRNPNNRLTKRAYSLACDTYPEATPTLKSRIRSRLARTYQDITAEEVYLIAIKR